MAKTYIDELVEYPAKAIQRIGLSKDVVALLLDDPNVEIGDDSADEVFDQYLFDYGYVDNTTTEAKAFVCVEAELIKTPTPTIQDLRLFVTIVCHKEYMHLDHKKFPGIIGNRKDNLVREVDKVLNGSEVFGIGVLSLDSVKTVNAPMSFTARELTYSIADFRNKGVARYSR